MKRCRLNIVLTLIMLGFWLPVAGAAVDSEPSDTGERFWTQEQTLLMVGGVAAGGLLTLIDDDLRRTVQSNSSAEAKDVAKGLDLAGGPPACAGYAAGIWLWGRISDDPYRQESGALALGSVILAEGVTQGLKLLSSRPRPEEGEADDFDWLAFDFERDSFPSAHASGAFALASVMARRSKGELAPWLWYGGATLVGVSRLVYDKHWASDVVVGALIGEVTGRAVLYVVGQKGWIAAPLILPEGNGGGLAVYKAF